MRVRLSGVGAALAFAVFSAIAVAANADDGNGCDDDRDGYERHSRKNSSSVQLGPRPFYLVRGMDEGQLKDRLLSCASGPFKRSDFSIALAARRCSSRNTPRNLTKPGHAWVPVSWNAT